MPRATCAFCQKRFFGIIIIGRIRYTDTHKMNLWIIISRTITFALLNVVIFRCCFCFCSWSCHITQAEHFALHSTYLLNYCFEFVQVQKVAFRVLSQCICSISLGRHNFFYLFFPSILQLLLLHTRLCQERIQNYENYFNASNCVICQMKLWIFFTVVNQIIDLCKQKNKTFSSKANGSSLK